MEKCLLLGNGLNIHFGIEELYRENIYKRFKDVLFRSSAIYESVFNVSLTPTIIDHILPNNANTGIEELAGKLHKYIYDRLETPNDSHNENMLIDIIKATSLNAIFYDGNCQIDMHKKTDSTVIHMNTYDHIYTLNYVEKWDNTNRCIFLHGKYDFPHIIAEGKNILLYDNKYLGLSQYKETLQKLSHHNHLVPQYFDDIVFSPMLDKQKVLDNRLLYPGANCFPGPTTFMYDRVILYKELDTLKSLDIFGMSPFGDDRLINKIAKVPNLTVFVHKMNETEVNEWNKKLNRNCCVDSSLFTSKTAPLR